MYEREMEIISAARRRAMKALSPLCSRSDWGPREVSIVIEMRRESECFGVDIVLLGRGS